MKMILQKPTLESVTNPNINKHVYTSFQIYGTIFPPRTNLKIIEVLERASAVPASFKESDMSVMEYSCVVSVPLTNYILREFKVL